MVSMGYSKLYFYIFFNTDFLLIPAVSLDSSLIKSLFAHFLNIKSNVPLFLLNHFIFEKTKKWR